MPADGGLGATNVLSADAATARAEWTPPLEQLGPAGWRESEQPLCHGGQGPASTYAIWSGSEGVYALATAAQGDFVVNYLERLLFNDGTGWRVLAESSEEGARGIVGVPNGPLIYYGDVDCGLKLFRPDEGLTCSSSVFPSAVFAVDEEHVYALNGDHVLRFDGNTWTQFGDPLDQDSQIYGDALWADHELMVVMADLEDSPVALYLRHEDEMTFTRVDGSGAPEGVYRAVWAFGEDDIWLSATEDKMQPLDPAHPGVSPIEFRQMLVHYDGSRFQKVSDELGGCGEYGTPSLWGMDGLLYFHTERSFGRILDGEIEILAQWPCDASGVGIRSMWGNSANEVFLAVSDNFALSECGSFFALWWDGQELHRF